jgi:hypothetical protein
MIKITQNIVQSPGFIDKVIKPSNSTKVGIFWSTEELKNFKEEWHNE